jgi:alpha/beta superfamily hydrolase
MNIVRTKSFELAIYSKGNNNSKKLAILIPGRLDSKDYINFVSHAEYLAKKDFFVVAFDPPGAWESPGTIDFYTTTNYIKAVNELIEYFGNKPTLLLGHSRGAAVAILVSTNQNVVGIISVMANYGAPTAPSEEAYKNGFQISYRDLPPGASRTKEQKEFVLPITYWEDGKQYNIIQSLKDCIKPKLIIYAINDEFTRADKVKKLFEQIPEPKMIKEVNCSHDYRYYPEIIKEVELEIGRFLNKYNL